MDFYKELLDSYGLLKKRKLRVSMNEAAATAPLSYAKIQQKAQAGEQEAQAAIQQADQVIQQAFGTTQGGAITNQVNPQVLSQYGVELQPTQRGGMMYNRQAVVSSAGEGNYKVSKKGLENVRTAVVQQLYTSGKQGEVDAMGMNAEDPGMVESMMQTGFDGLVDELSDGDEKLKAKMGAMLQRLSRMAERFEDDEELGPLVQEALDPANPNSIYQQVLDLMKDDGELGQTLDSMGYDTSTRQEALGALELLRKQLEVADILNKNTTMTEGVKALLRPKLVEVYDRSKIIDGRMYERDEMNDIGISISRDLQDMLRDRVKGAEDWYANGNKADAKDYKTITKEIEQKAEEAVHRGPKDPNKKKKKNGSRVVLTKTSEGLDNALAILYLGDVEGFKKAFFEAFEDDMDTIAAALSIAIKYEGGEAVNESMKSIMMELEDYGISGDVEELKRLLDEDGNVSQEGVDKLINVIATIGKHRMSRIKRCKPDGLIRMGGRTDAGWDGQIADQAMVFKTKEGYQRYIDNNPGCKNDRKPIKLSEYFLDKPGKDEKESELEQLKRQFGLNPDDECYVIPESIKTVSGTRDYIAVGSSGSMNNVAREFLNKNDEYAGRVLDFMGLDSDQKESLRQGMGQLRGIEKEILDLADSMGMNATSSSEQRKAFLDKLGSLESFKAMGIDFDRLTEKDYDGPQCVRVLMRAAFLKRMENGVNSEDPAEKEQWTNVAGAYMLRNAMSGDEAEEILDNTGKDTLKIHNRNKLLKCHMAELKAGRVSFNKTGFSIGKGSTFMATRYAVKKADGKITTRGESEMSTQASLGMLCGDMKEETTSPDKQKLLEEMVELQRQFLELLIKE